MASFSISTPMHVSSHCSLWLIEGPRTMAVMCLAYETAGSPDGTQILVIWEKSVFINPSFMLLPHGMMKC